MATQEPVESGSCPSVTRGVYVVVVLENLEMRRGRLGGTGSLSENPGSAPETNGERPRIIGWGGRVTWPGSGCIGPREGVSPNGT